MRVRDHVALSSTAAALLYPRFGRSVLLPWAASIFIDVDHYLWFVIRHRRVNPVAAVRFFNDSKAPTHSATRPFHHPAVLLPLMVLAWRRRAIALPTMGLAFHVCLDTYHRLHLADAQVTALKRDKFACQVCGARNTDVVVHVWRQPRLLPSYRVEHFVTLCGACHTAAHSQRIGAVAHPGRDWNSYRESVEQRAGTPGCGPNMDARSPSPGGLGRNRCRR